MTDERMINVGRQTHMSSADALAMCQRRRGEQEITDACAVTVASFWQSSGTRGSAFAALASTGTVELQTLLDDIHYSYVNEAGSLDDKLMLDMLATWAINVAGEHV